MRGKTLLVSAVIALVAFSGILLAMTSEEIAKLPSEERVVYEKKIVVNERINTLEAYRATASPDRVMVSRDGEYVATELTRRQIIGTRSESEKAVILEEGFEGAWPPTGWTLIQTNTDVSGPSPGYWTQTDGSPGSVGVHSGAYNSGLWWSYSHQDEWLITSDIDLTTGSGTYYVTFWTYGYEGSTYADHYYVKVSTDGGTIWTELFDMSAQPGNAWNYWAYSYAIDLSAYAGETIKLAWQAVDGPTNDGLWYEWFVDDISVWYPLDHDVGVTAINAPTGSYMPGVSVTPSVEVENFGSNNETFDVTFKIYNGTRDEVYSETETDVTVNTGATQTVDFPAWTTAIGSYTTEAYTELGIDEEPSNDTLTGDFDVSMVVPEDTIHFDGPWDNNGVGLTEGGTFEGAIRITPDELGDYSGWQLSSVTFFHHEAGTHSCNIKIYEGDTPTSPGALITQEPYTAIGQGWHRIDLSSPVLLDVGNDLWVSVEVTHVAGEYPIGVDAGPAVQGKGDWVYISPGPWEELWPMGLSLNWNIRAIVETGIQLDHDVAALSIIEPSGTYTAGTVVAPKTRIKNFGLNTETFYTYFKIYDGARDEVYSEVINTTLAPGLSDTLTFPDFTVDEGSFEAVSYTDLDIDENPANDSAYSTFGAISYVQDFESGVFPPYGWETYMTGDVAGNHGWQSLYVGCPDVPACAPYEGNYGAWHQDDMVTCEDWLVTSPVEFGPGAQISFYQYQYFATYYEYHGIWVSTGSPDPADGDYVEVEQIPVGTGAWTPYGPIDLSSYSGLTGYIAFKYTGYFADHWYIDFVTGTGITEIVPEHDIEVFDIITPGVDDIFEGDIVIPQVVVINRGNVVETFPMSFEIFDDGGSVYYSEVTAAVASGAWDTVSFAPWTALEGSFNATTIASCPGDVNPYNDTLDTSFSVYSWAEDFELTDGRFVAYVESGTIGWEWGAPTSGPGSAHSGDNLWATVLDDDYEDDADYSLIREFHALSDSPFLSFWLWYDTESGYDGGNVKITVEDSTWVVSPTRGYDRTANTSNPLYPESIFSGHDQGYWELVDFDLADYVSEGDSFFIRWHFGSDGSVPYPGLYVDDVLATGLTGQMRYDTWVNSICAEPGFEVIEPGYAVHLCAEVENNRLGPDANFRVYMKIMDSEGNLVYSSSKNVRDLAAGSVRIVWFSPDWVPAAETYTLRVLIQNAFESPALQDNNMVEMEVLIGGGGKMAVDEAPEVYFLSQSHPNPVKDRARIAYGLPTASGVNLKVYDITGRVVRTLVNCEQSAGYKSVDWNLTDDSGKRVARGIYFYKIAAGDFKSTKKLVIVE